MTYTPARALVINDGPVTVPVPGVVQEALERWAISHADELVGVLAPYGLHPFDVAVPQYRRMVKVDDA